MTIFWRCHVIVSKKLADDRRHVCDFIYADFSGWEGTSTLFLTWTPFTNADIFPCYYDHFEKTLNLSAANDSLLQ